MKDPGSQERDMMDENVRRRKKFLDSVIKNLFPGNAGDKWTTMDDKDLLD